MNCAERGRLCVWSLLAFILLPACSLVPKIPVVLDPDLGALVEREAKAIIAVADLPTPRSYRIALADFPRRDLLGLSLGSGRIYISYELTRRASADVYYLWMLRQTLAHEIAHEVAEHAKQGGALASQITAEPAITSSDLGVSMRLRFQNYAVEKELEADREGMDYWRRLDWDCGIWIGILRNFQQQRYRGDRYHPTDRRLWQAVDTCSLTDRTRAEQPGPAR